MRTKLWPFFLIVAVLLTLTAGQAQALIKGELLGTILTTVSDTTAAFNTQQYYGAHLGLFWTQEDSITVVPQVSGDGGTTWAPHPIFTSTVVDGGTSPYAYFRDLGVLPADGSGEAIAGCPWTHIRFILTGSGSDTLKTVKVLLQLDE